MPEVDDNPFLIDNSAPPVTRVRNPYDEIIERHAKRTGIDPNLIRAVMGQESSSNPTAVSPRGARGLMQLMPPTAARFGVTNVNDPEQNIRGGTDYLKFLHDKFQGNTDLVLAGYNAGEGAVEKHGNRIPPYRETQQYVPAVKARYQKLSGQQPPVDQNPFLIDPQQPAKPENPFLVSEVSVQPGAMATGSAEPSTSWRRFGVGDQKPTPLTTNDAAWHFGMTPEEAKRLTPKARNVLTEAVAEDLRKKNAGQTIQRPSLKYQNDMRKAAGLKPLKFNVTTDETTVAPYYQSSAAPFSISEKPPIGIKPRPFTFNGRSDEDVKAEIRNEVTAASRAANTHLHPEARGEINRTDIESVVNDRFNQYKADQARATEFARLGPSMQARTPGDLSERVRESLGDIAAKFNIDTPGGLKTDALRSAVSALNVIPGPSAAILNLFSQPREITREEKLLDPNAEWDAKMREFIGRNSVAFLPYVGAGKIISELGVVNPVFRDALTFGITDASKQLAQTGTIDPESVAESVLTGGAMGKIAGVDPSLKRRLVAYIAPQLAASVAKGESPNDIIQNVTTSALFALAGGKEGEPKTAAELLSRGAKPSQSVPEELQAKLTAPEKPKPIIRHSDPRIDGGEVVGQTSDGRLKVQNNEGGVSIVQHPRTQGNREAAIVNPTEQSAIPPAETPQSEAAQPVMASTASTPSEGGVSSFTTSQGSTYTVSGETTTRTKSKHLMHDPKDVGLKEPSRRTVYVTPDQATEIGAHGTLNTEAKPRVELTDEGIVLTNKYGKGWTQTKRQVFPYTASPEVGKAPVEFFERGKYHAGNEIIKVEGSSAAPQEVPKTAEPLASQPAEAQNVSRESPAAQTQKNVVQPEIREPRQPKSPAISGTETRVSIPDSKESYPARYEVREAADVYSSHDPVSFLPNSEYYHENDRRYDQEKQYQAQVIDRARNLDPSQLINNAPTSELGPPIIDEDGNALGGNSRTMIIKRAYRDPSPQAREAYRKALTDQATVYGVDPAKIAEMREPVLVRALSDQGLEKNVQQTITELNRSSVTPLTREEQASAGAARMSEGSADFISRRIERHGEDGTLTNAMNDSGAEIVNKLIEDGVLSPGERNTLLKNGKATPEAKARVERLLTGRIYDDVAQMERTPPSVRNNIERAAPALLKIENSEWDIGSDLKRAIDATTEARSSGMTLEEVQRQTSMVRAPFTDRQIAIAKVLSEGPRKATAKFQAYAGEFDNARQGGGLFGARSPEEAFAQHFEGRAPAIEEPSMIKAAKEREAKRAEEKQQGIQYRHAGADPYELIDKMLIKGYELYKKGRPKFEEWARKMRKEFGKDAESHFSDFYARITASQSVSDGLRKARSLPKTLEASGRQPGTELEYDVLPNPTTISTVADRLARDGVDKTEEWYRQAEPSAERSEAFRQIGDQLLVQAVNEKDAAKAQELIERGTQLANVEAPRGTTLGQTIQAYSMNTKYSPSGALLEATKLAERSKTELSKEDRDFIVRKAVEHQEADTNVTALREQIDLFPDVNRKPKTVEERIKASGQDEQVVHGAVQLLKDRDMGRGEFYREMKKKFGLSHEEATSVFQKSYRLLKDSRKANVEETRLAKIKKANPTATEQRVQELYDHLNNEVKRRREAKMELARAFARLEKTNRGWWHRLLNLQRGLLVSTFPTAIRNAQTQFQRLGVEALTDAVEITLRKAVRLDSPVGYRDAWSHVAQGFDPRSRRRAEAVLQEFPSEHEQVFGRYASDVELPNTGPLTRGAETLLGKAEQGVALLNWANTLQEFHLRGAEFLSKLNQELKARGLPPAETYLRRGNSEDIPIEAVKRASKSALEVTFADKPNYNTVADALIKVGNQIPASVSPIPFPRFFYNSMKFLYQYNPTGLVDLARKSTENRPRVVAKAMVGTAMLLTAYGLRKSDYAGEKWYELRVPGTDRLVDMRPFGPFSLYLFLAEAMRRGFNKQAMRPEEIKAAVGIGGSRGDSPWEPMDRTYDLLTTGNQTKRERAWKALKSEGGEATASLLTPVRQVKDIVAQFDKSEAVRRNTDVEPFLGPIKETIPYANRNAKPVYTGTSKEPVQQDYPLLKTLSGYRVEQQKNFIQKELDRLRFTSQEIVGATGIPEIDTRTKELMGQIVGTQAEKLQYNRGYQQASDGRKALILREMLREARTAARERAEGENPGLARKLQMMRQSQRDQDVGVPAGGGSRRSPFQSRPLERPNAP